MSIAPSMIAGGSHTDLRGTISFLNDFDLTSIKRFYKIKHPDVAVKRGWRGHRIEQRWFHVTKGAFSAALVEIDDWKKPNPHAEIIYFVLRCDQNSVLHVPTGYASSLQAMEAGSEVLVFADFDVSHAPKDDYLFPIDYFINY